VLRFLMIRLFYGLKLETRALILC